MIQTLKGYKSQGSEDILTLIEHVGVRNSHPPRHPSPRTLIPLEHPSPWNTHPPETPIPLEFPSPGTPIPHGTPIPLEHPSPHGTFIPPLII